MNANSNMPQLDPERLNQMISLATSYPQDLPVPVRMPRAASWQMADWFRTPALVPIPVRAFAVVAVLAVLTVPLLPDTRPATLAATDTIAMAQDAGPGHDAYSEVSDYLMMALLDDLS